MRKLEVIAVFAALAVATPVMAQGRGRGNRSVPPGQRPAAGMCRIWIDGLPPGQQPAPTDCSTAASRVPYNGRVIYGDRTDEQRRDVYDSNGQIATAESRPFARATTMPVMIAFRRVSTELEIECIALKTRSTTIGVACTAIKPTSIATRTGS
jgi:hypothetical protein